MATETSDRIMAAARSCLLADGYANLSTRKVADGAGVPLSQIHYHFGGKQGMVLALLDYENRRLVSRQRQMYAGPVPLWKRYEQACDFLEEDLASGYVRVLQEMIAAGWSDSAVAAQVLTMLRAGSRSSRRWPARRRTGSARSAHSPPRNRDSGRPVVPRRRGGDPARRRHLGDPGAHGATTGRRRHPRLRENPADADLPARAARPPSPHKPSSQRTVCPSGARKGPVLLQLRLSCRLARPD